MIEANSTSLEAYEQDFERSARKHLLPLRRAAMDRFLQLGFPTTWHEEWRYTNIAPLVKTPHRRHEPATTRLSAADIARFHLGIDNEVLLVLVNGRYDERLSRVAGLPQGVRVMGLATALDQKLAPVIQHLGHQVDYAEHAFAALNTAFLEDGALVWVPRDFAAPSPIRVLHLCVPHAPHMIVHPRILIVAEDGSRLRVVEHYAASGDDAYITNTLTELFVGTNADVEHTRIIREAGSASHVGRLHIHQERDSRVSAHTISLDGRLIRNDIDARLAGEGADCELDGLSMLRGRQHVDNHLRVEHARPHCTSREFFRGILDDGSRGVFAGRIIVRPGAQKTDAKQTNRNLLLSGNAQVDSKPQLEIYADDVKCTHGATIGQVDENAVFYLRSRGIDEATARGLLVYAFAREGLDRIRIEPLRRQLAELVLQRLPDGELLRDEP